MSAPNRIETAVAIQAPLERIWRALCEAAALSAWFHVAIEGGIGQGREVWMTTTHPDYAGMRFPIRFAEMTPCSRVVWQWHPGAVDPAVDYSREQPATVAFTLEPVEGGTRLILAEAAFEAVPAARRERVYLDNSRGWPDALNALTKYAEAAT